MASKIHMFTKPYESTQDYFISQAFLYEVLTIRTLDMKQEKKKLNLIICTSQLYSEGNTFQTLTQQSGN